MQYTTPSRDVPVKLRKAVQLCIDKYVKIWDQHPQQGLGFDEIRFREEYWIASDDASMGRFTTSDVPELVYDKICTWESRTTRLYQ